MKIRIEFPHLSPTPPIQDGEVLEPGSKLSFEGVTYVLDNGGEAKVETKPRGKDAFISIIEITVFSD